MSKFVLTAALAALLLSACNVESPTPASASSPDALADAAAPMSTLAAPISMPTPESGAEACEPDGADYGAVIDDGTALRERPGDGATVAELTANQFVCLHGDTSTDASGAEWQRVTVIPTALEPACTARPGDCPTTPAGADAGLADCRIGAGRYGSGCPSGWVSVSAVEAYSMGLGGRSAEPAGVEDAVGGDGASDAAAQDVVYAVDAASGRLCEGLARVGDDGLKQTPVLRLRSPGAEARTVPLDVAAGRYQARATHCLIDGDAALVLVQSDTDPSAALNQTLLRIDRVGVDDGRVLATVDLPLPEGTRSRWVTTSDGFTLQDGALVVRGLERGDGDAAADAPFTARFDPLSLAPQEK